MLAADNNVDGLLKDYWQKLKKGTFSNSELQDDFTKFGADIVKYYFYPQK